MTTDSGRCTEIGEARHEVPEVATAVDRFLDLMHTHGVAALVYVAKDDKLRGYKHTCGRTDAWPTIDAIALHVAGVLARDALVRRELPPNRDAADGWRPFGADDLEAVEAWSAGRRFHRRYAPTDTSYRTGTRTELDVGVFTPADVERGLAAEWMRGIEHESGRPSSRAWIVADAAPLAHAIYRRYADYRGYRQARGEVIPRWSTDDVADGWDPQPVLLDDAHAEREAWALAAGVGRAALGPGPYGPAGLRLADLACAMYIAHGESLGWQHASRPIPRWSRQSAGPGAFTLDDGGSESEYVKTGWLSAAEELAEVLRVLFDDERPT